MSSVGNKFGLIPIAAASVVAQVGPVFTVNRGFSGVVRNGAGDYSLTLDRGVDTTECVILSSPRLAADLAGSDWISCSSNHTSDTVKTHRTLQEQGGGAASALADINFDIIVCRVGWGRAQYGISLAGACAIPAGGGALTFGKGIFGGAVLNTGAGLNTVGHDPIDATQSIILALTRGVIAASGATSHGLVRTSDTVLNVSTVVEQAGGAASILADVAFDLLAFQVL